MCGRYMLTSPVDALRQLFLFEQRPNLMPRYNIAPTQDVPIVRLTRDGTERELVMARWGLVPFWADDLKIGNRLINARRESVQTMRPFREAYQRRRCLVPADGFFEWRKEGKARQPLLFRRKDRAPFAFAGLWERWKSPADGAVVRSCTIITCPANELVAAIHDRMPVILAPDDHARWLDPAATPAATDGRSLLAPCPAAWLESLPVNPRVNNPRHDDVACIQPAFAQDALAL
jgi:putative SOS response-associated peptidase YedK